MMRDLLIVTPSIPGVTDSAPELETAGKEENEHKFDSAADAPGNTDHDNNIPQQSVEDHEESGISSESSAPSDTNNAENGSADQRDGGDSRTEENEQEESSRTEETNTGDGSGDSDRESPESESETESESKSETESESETGTELESESQTETETETESQSESQTETETETETESESQTETESESQTQTETESESEYTNKISAESNPGLTGQELETYLLNLMELGEDIEPGTETLILHEDLIQIHEDLQVLCCFIIVFLIILLCHYIYKFFKIFF